MGFTQAMTEEEWEEWMRMKGETRTKAERLAATSKRLDECKERWRKKEQKENAN